MPLVATKGAASAQGFGEFAQQTAANYIEDVFSTYLYTGNGSTQTITNGIDLSGKGGLVWVKTRTTNTGGGTYNNSHILADSARTPSNILRTNGTEAQDGSPSFSSFNSNGFTLGTSANTNNTGVNSVSWTFRKQKKFFDVVTYTGNGSGSGQTINHNLGSVPGCIMIKNVTTGPTGWCVFHKDVNGYFNLTTNAASSTVVVSNVTSTSFDVANYQFVNGSGDTMVAYLFAHNAGGFGTAGADNVISCGSFTTNGSGIIPTVNLGYEPQWLMFKSATSVDSWYMADNMRGWYNQSADQFNGLRANLSNAEVAGFNGPIITPTGFTGPSASFGASNTFIYIAIRRPMKTPTSGTSVFSPVTYTGNDGTQVLTTGFAVDAEIVNNRDPGGQGWQPAFLDRLRGNGWYLASSGTAVEGDYSTGVPTEFQSNTAVNRTSSYLNYGGGGGPLWTFVTWALRRAPGFFDVVCYTSGNSTNTRVTHNLGVAPELIIVKTRSAPPVTSTAWGVYVSSEGRSKYMLLYKTDASTSFTDAWGTSNPTTTDFGINDSATGFFYYTATAVAYLFATVAGVSKVGSYTGTGTTQTINCGFTAGARFVMIKRTDSTGDWYVWDSARGIVSGNDPYLLLNSNAAEVTNTDYVDTASSGFEISSTAPAAINANGGSFIFLAIA